MRSSGFSFDLLQRCRSGWCSCIGLSILLGCLTATSSWEAIGVPAFSNESIINGDLLERTAIDSASVGIEPRQKLWRFKLRIVSVENVAGSENALRGQEGKVIEVYSNEVNAPVGTDSRIKVRISFHSDERAGRYWIIGGNESKTK